MDLLVYKISKGHLDGVILLMKNGLDPPFYTKNHNFNLSTNSPAPRTTNQSKK
jgi:hypothetical protein